MGPVPRYLGLDVLSKSSTTGRSQQNKRKPLRH